MIVRIRFDKKGKVRWTSHRDVARAWERALRRARLPVSYTAGFSPRPQLSFGLALPTGCESSAEYLDVALDTEIDPEKVGAHVGPLLPSGIGVLAAGIPEVGRGSLQEEVTSCTWEIRVPGRTGDDLRHAVATVMAADSLPVQRERKGRVVSDDLRPSLHALLVAPDDEQGRTGHRVGRHVHASEAHRSHLIAHAREPVLLAELGTRPRGVRPAELAQVMGLELGLVRRTGQWIERDGSRLEPLAVRAAVTAGAEERAS